MKRYFVYKDDTSDKFWSIQVAGNSMLVTYGKTGTAGVAKTKEFNSEAEAQGEAATLIAEKIKKGYRELADQNVVKFVEFWALIERAKNQSDDMDELVDALVDSLSSRSETDIIEFGKIFYTYLTASYRSNLWAAAYIINGGCSDDAFDYFRAWLIAQGKDVYFNTLSDPEYLTHIIDAEDAGDIECEDMLSVAGRAYAQKTGESPEKIYDFIPAELMRNPEITIDWDEEGDDLKNMFPQLWKKFCNY